MTHSLHLPLMDDILVNELHNVNLLTFNSPPSSQYWIFHKWRHQSFFMYRGNGVSWELSSGARRELRHSEHLHSNPSESIESYCLIRNSRPGFVNHRSLLWLQWRMMMMIILIVIGAQSVVWATLARCPRGVINCRLGEIQRNLL